MVLFLGVCSCLKGQAILSSQYTFSDILDANDLSIANEAGTDLTSAYETPVNFNLLDIKNVKPNQGWRVVVSKQDINWNASLVVSVKRNSAGAPCGTCLGVQAGMSGTNYMVVNAMETDFIFGSGEVNDIAIQFMVSGISVLLPAQAYSTEITFTLYGD